MSKTPIQSYQDLQVWQEGMNLAESCYLLTRNFPKEETYGITTQIRRSAVSIPANIAEGYGRKTRGEYIQFLYIAQGSLKELETHMILSKRVNLIEAQSIDSVLAQCQLVGRLLQGLIRSLENK
ncbi:four helix bundle protein [aff. Roholtiella sp. LEGE 12411]|uniref:four helix bundle protein n=1 Tax=aff. Roholtiella sp. LEGE 12411 TaxID=1828822 RepID=UPI00187F70E2|nr:four helix bundle protein [aff. Roholtiella sp. LEGE 12411]MBE9036602.1 four helix bundle protein [aff. Roholtiella sp. LEGE 12411]